MIYVYGYTQTVLGESKRVELGTVDESEYQAKKREIDYANFVSSGGLDERGPDNTKWFIEKTIQDGRT